MNSARVDVHGRFIPRRYREALAAALGPALRDAVMSGNATRLFGERAVAVGG